MPIRMAATWLIFDAVFHVIHNPLIIVARLDGDSQQVCGIDVLLTEELAVTSSAIHQVCR